MEWSPNAPAIPRTGDFLFGTEEFDGMVNSSYFLMLILIAAIVFGFLFFESQLVASLEAY
jgi:copper homeostasis protein CutC